MEFKIVELSVSTTQFRFDYRGSVEEQEIAGHFEGRVLPNSRIWHSDPIKI